ncbi:hypothetical protein [Polymorphum gilvum]|nr:hypothetical protein [Polymorphum gilvum]
MNRSRSLLQCLRSERHPVAVLAALAIAVRLALLVISAAVVPQAADAGFGVLCQTQGVDGTPRPLGGHDPDDCPCGPACLHHGLVAVADDRPVGGRALADAAGRADPMPGDEPSYGRFPHGPGPIRAPPLS